MARLDPLRRRIRSVFAVEQGGPDWTAGLRMAVVVGAPLVTAVAFGRLDIAPLVTLGALNVALADPGGPYGIRFAATTAASITMTIALVVTTLIDGAFVPAVLLAGLWVFAAAFTADFGRAVSGVGFVAAVMFVVGLGLPPDSAALPTRVSWFLAGCCWSVAAASFMWPLRPDLPTRSAIAGVYRSVADFLRDAPHDETDRARSLSRIAVRRDEARTATVHGLRGRGMPSRQAVTALYAAGTVELGLGSLDRAFAALGAVPASLRAGVEALAGACDGLADSVRSGGDWDPADLARSRRAVDSATVTGETAVARDQLSVMMATLIRPGVPRIDTGSRARALGAAGRRVGRLFHTDSLVFRHALRLGFVVAVAQAIAMTDPFEKGYWIPLTVIVVLKPDLGSTVDQGLQRIGGTIIGVIVAFAVVDLAGGEEWVIVGSFVVMTFAFAAVAPISYTLAVVAITPLVILLLSLGGGDQGLVAARLVTTLVGAALALAGGFLLWPMWARRTIRGTLAAAATAAADYLAQVIGDGSSTDEIRGAHRSAERARSNAAAARHRMLSEPRSSWIAPADVTAFCQLLQGLEETTTGLRAALRVDSRRPDGSPDRPGAVRRRLEPTVELLGDVSATLVGEGTTGPGALTRSQGGTDDELGLLAATIDRAADGMNRAAGRIAAGA